MGVWLLSLLIVSLHNLLGVAASRDVLGRPALLRVRYPEAVLRVSCPEGCPKTFLRYPEAVLRAFLSLLSVFSLILLQSCPQVPPW